MSTERILEVRLWSLSSPTTFFSYMDGGDVAAPDKVAVRWVDDRGVCFDGLEGGFTNEVHGRMPVEKFLTHYVPTYP